MVFNKSEKNKELYLSYTFGFLSLVATLASFVSQELRITIFIIGVMGLAVSLVLMKINEYINKIEENDKEIQDLKRELDYHKNHTKLRIEMESIKRMLKEKKGGAYTNFILIVLILLMFYLILVSLGILKF